MGSKFFEELSRCLGKEQIESLTPGEVTQEQVDQSANGMIACPCCGRWSPFHCVEQAENEENKLGMEMMPQ